LLYQNRAVVAQRRAAQAAEEEERAIARRDDVAANAGRRAEIVALRPLVAAAQQRVVAAKRDAAAAVQNERARAARKLAAAAKVELADKRRLIREIQVRMRVNDTFARPMCVNDTFACLCDDTFYIPLQFIFSTKTTSKQLKQLEKYRNELLSCRGDETGFVHVMSSYADLLPILYATSANPMSLSAITFFRVARTHIL
jgi:hypothetical protein